MKHARARACEHTCLAIIKRSRFAGNCEFQVQAEEDRAQGRRHLEALSLSASNSSDFQRLARPSQTDDFRHSVPLCPREKKSERMALSSVRVRKEKKLTR